MKSPFRRRRRRPRSTRPAERQPEIVDWPQDGTGTGGLMNAIRGDASTGSGGGAGMFNDLAAAFGGSGKQIQLEEQEKEKERRHELHTEADGSARRPDLDSGTIRIPRPER